MVDTPSPVHHIWKLNTYGKIKQYVIRYQRKKDYNDTYFDFTYDDKLRLKEFKTYTCFLERIILYRLLQVLDTIL